MIAKIKGRVDQVVRNSLIIQAGHLGYQVFVPTRLLSDCGEGKKVTLWTHQVVREDDISLYGFADFDDLRIFELLLSVSGIGPKMALGVLSAATAAEVTAAIQKSDAELFHRVSGIGKKNAGRIVIDLRSKLGATSELDLAKLAQVKASPELAEALKKLGYGRAEIKAAINQIDHDQKLEDQIRAALRLLA